SDYDTLSEKANRLWESLEKKHFNIYVGIRPEGFVHNEKGVLTLNLQNIEVMGRDKSVISTHEASIKPTIRSIIESGVHVKEAETVKFDLSLPITSIFCRFNVETEKRLR
nr:hypothetical protein [Acholeplasmatales bacterium]